MRIFFEQWKSVFEDRQSVTADLLPNYWSCFTCLHSMTYFFFLGKGRLSQRTGMTFLNRPWSEVSRI